MNADQLERLKKEHATDKLMVALIDELATEKGFIEVNPKLTLKTINEILNKRHPFFKLVDCKLTLADEGSMAMEYHYDVIFEETDNHILYGVKLYAVPLIRGEIWDDYVANEGEDLLEVHKIKKHKVEIIEYKFEKLK